jgi:hypothetical protein
MGTTSVSIRLPPARLQLSLEPQRPRDLIGAGPIPTATSLKPIVCQIRTPRESG